MNKYECLIHTTLGKVGEIVTLPDNSQTIQRLKGKFIKPVEESAELPSSDEDDPVVVEDAVEVVKHVAKQIVKQPAKRKPAKRKAKGSN